MVTPTIHHAIKLHDNWFPAFPQLTVSNLILFSWENWMCLCSWLSYAISIRNHILTKNRQGLDNLFNSALIALVSREWMSSSTCILVFVWLIHVWCNLGLLVHVDKTVWRAFKQAGIIYRTFYQYTCQLVDSSENVPYLAHERLLLGYASLWWEQHQMVLNDFLESVQTLCEHFMQAVEKCLWELVGLD